MRLSELTPAVLIATGRGAYGSPRSFKVAADGSSILFLRSSGARDAVQALWRVRADGNGGWEKETSVFDPSSKRDVPSNIRSTLDERTRENATGVTRFSSDQNCRRVVFEFSQSLWLYTAEDGKVRKLPQVKGSSPKVAPDGTKVAVLTPAGLAVHQLPSGKVVAKLRADSGTTIGAPDFIAAEELFRFHGMWWSPDSAQLLTEVVDDNPLPQWTIANPAEPARPAKTVRYPVAGGKNSRLSLRILDCKTGIIEEIRWSHTSYPYLHDAIWSTHGLTLDLQSRDQKRLATFRYDTGRKKLVRLMVLEDKHWIEVGNGTRTHGPNGELCQIVDGTKTRTLEIGKVTARLPKGANVHRFISRMTDGCLVQIIDTPEERVLALILWDGSVKLLTNPGDVATGWGSARTVVVQTCGYRDATPKTVIADLKTSSKDGLQKAATIPTNSEPYEWVEKVETVAIGKNAITTALLLPSRPSKGRLPIVVSSYGGPIVASVLNDRRMYVGARWFAEQGFAVIITDGVGAPGRGPAWERQIAGNFTKTLTSQVKALDYWLAKKPHILDGDRVGIRGWSFGGYLSALAVLKAPDRFHAAVSGAPVTDWLLYDTHYTERYLGLSDELIKNAQKSSLLTMLDELGQKPASMRPLLLLHGLSDDNVFAANSVRFSETLTARGIPHSTILPSSFTHVGRGDIAAGLMSIELTFLREHLVSSTTQLRT